MSILSNSNNTYEVKYQYVQCNKYSNGQSPLTIKFKANSKQKIYDFAQKHIFKLPQEETRDINFVKATLGSNPDYNSFLFSDKRDPSHYIRIIVPEENNFATQLKLKKADIQPIHLDLEEKATY